jgi:hypothetical protein
VALVVLVVVVALAGIPGALGARAYGLDSPNAVDVPDQTVRGAGEFLTVREIARVQRGDTFEVQATAPDDAAYEVELVNMYGTVVDVSERTLRGDESTTFETDGIPAGSYVAVLRHQGTPKAVLPVVVAGYEVSTAVTDTAEAGTEVTVSADVTAAQNAPNRERVEVIVVDRSTKEMVVRKTMTADREGYSATIQLEEPGEYGLCVNVRGERSVRGFDELLGFGDAHTLSVTAPASPTAESAPAAAATTGTATPAGAATASTTVPEGVITRNATASPPTTGADSPTTALSVVFALLLAAGLGLLYWIRV